MKKAKLLSVIALTFIGSLFLFSCGKEEIPGPQGEQGIQGETGIGIESIEKSGSEGLVDIYTITFSDGTTSTFAVTNGKDGVDGTQGIQGIQGEPGEDGHTPVITIQEGYWYIDGENTNVLAEGIKGDTGNGVSDVKLTNTEGLVDTYTIIFTDGTTSTFTLTNGQDGVDGKQGIQGIQGVPGKDGHTPVITIENGYWHIDGVSTLQEAQGVKGETGNGISSITKTSTEGLVDVYTITYTDGNTSLFTVTNGAKGDQGEQGIQGIQGVPGEDGHTPVITIQDGYWYIDGVSTLQAAQGVKGETGNGISSITKTNTSGLVDTYTITYTDGTTSTFTVTNGKDGVDGEQGIQGIPGEDGHTPVITIENGYWYIDGVNTQQVAQGVKGDTGNGISSIIKTSTSGLVDTYTITYTDGTTSTFIVTNGKDGEDGEQGIQGIQGIQGVPGEDGHTPVITIQDGYWHIDGVNTQQVAQGVKGDTGNGIAYVDKICTEGLIDTYEIMFTDGTTTTFTVTNGKDGSDTSLSIDDEGYWVINGETTQYKSEGNIDYLMSLIGGYFEIEKDAFVTTYVSSKDPSWNYLSSTFSGWGGSIGKPESFEAIAIKVRARNNPITKIKFHLNINDKNGISIFSEEVNVSIGAFEEKEIIWILPEKVENNKDNLYLSYNCNQFCDVYSNFSSSSLIPNNEYQAVTSYSTNGRLLTDANQMTNVTGNVCRYLYAKVGNIQDVLINKNVREDNINIYLPDEYYLAVNDNFQLFYRGVVQAVNPYNYHINVVCSKGKVYPRYYEWKPTIDELGTYTLKMTIKDNNGKLLGTDTTKLIVVQPQQTNETQNVLCIGDSLTAGGYWVREAERRFNESGGTPEGLDLQYLNFIGTKQANLLGKTTSFEGYGGWTWASFCGENSPFYDEELTDISFKSYCEKNNYEDIDLVYILLTWNGQGTPYKTDYDVNKGHFVYAQKLIDKIHEDYPNAQIRCLGIQMPSQNGGMGENYGATGAYSDAYGILVSAMNYNKCLEDLCKLDKYSSFVKFVDVAGQFDTDYNMPSKEKPVNNRNNNTEVIGTNGVHPTVNGYYQIADAVFRSLCEVYQENS